MVPYTAQDRLFSRPRVGQANWSAALTKRIRGFEANQISDLYHRLAPKYSLNPDLALAQFCEETGWGTSDRWQRQNNPAGIGITSDDVAGPQFESPEEGIQAHLDHLCCYAYGVAMCPVPHGATPDPRHLFHDGIPALSHLQEPKPGRRWAEKPGYISRILAIVNSLPQASPAPPGPTKGANMPPRPTIVPKPSPNRGGYAHPHEPQCVVWHITQGTDSLGWLRSPASKASANYLIARDGTIYELVEPTVSAWANGIADSPNLANPIVAACIKQKRNLNTVSISIEHEGFTSNNKGGSLTPAQIAATIALTAWLCGEFGIPADRAHIFGHNQIDSVNRPYCPGFSEAEWQSWVASVAARASGETQPAPQSKPQPTSERDQLLSYANALPFDARGNLAREGVADLSQFGGGKEERVARYERLVAHRLAGASHVLTLDLYDQLRQDNKIQWF